MSGHTKQTRTMKVTMPIGTQSSNDLKNLRKRDGPASNAALCGTPPPPRSNPAVLVTTSGARAAIANPWVENGVQQVGDKCGDNHRHCDDRDDRLHDDHV